MAITKVLVEKTSLQSIADTIRTKEGEENGGTMKPAEMADRISKLGGVGEVQSIQITNKDAFSNLSFNGDYLTIPLEVEVLPAKAPQLVQVTSSDPKMARILNDGDGTYSVHIVKGGKCTITVADYTGEYTDTVTFSIEVPLEDISFAYSSLNVAEGGTRQLHVQFKPATATNQTLEWSSTHEGITVTQGGLVTATTTGSATISARSEELSKTITCNIEVAAYPETADFMDLKANPQNYGLGSLLPDKLSNEEQTYDFNWRVVDNNYEVTLPDGSKKTATILMMDKTLPFGNKFSTEKPITCSAETDPTAEADAYYYGLTESSCVEIDVQVGDPLPYSEYSKIVKSGLHFTKNLTSSEINRTYTNRWDGSEIRAILNSDADNVKTSYQPVHITDVVDYSKKGFLQMVNPDLISVASKIQNTTIENNSVFDGQAYTTEDLFWLPSIEQLNFVSTYGSRPAERSGEEGLPFQYFVNEIGEPNNSGKPSRVMTQMGKDSNSIYWLRSANFSNSYYECFGGSGGSLSYDGAGIACPFAAACAIIH